ncbi:hypothetical protein glysoja_029267 [Glycine soja]|uniref:Uncharacterized protein n=1 Tax=Glycine soja TaxID=3848 RepID=A0A0B2R2S4_GLYSO|nr:hypothetical protein glysoja_029267 [Glycine soja]
MAEESEGPIEEREIIPVWLSVVPNTSPRRPAVPKKLTSFPGRSLATLFRPHPHAVPETGDTT